MADWKQIAGAVAPTIATGLFGPLGGVVASIAGKILFGDEDKEPTPQSVADNIASIADPDGFVKLKQAELAVKQFEADNAFRFADLAAKDTQSARAMRTDALAKGNDTADTMGWAVLGSFTLTTLLVLFGCYLVLAGDLRMTPENSAVWVAVAGLVGTIIGYFAANAQQVVSFFFGSSTSAADKSGQLGAAFQSTVEALGRVPQPISAAIHTPAPVAVGQTAAVQPTPLAPPDRWRQDRPYVSDDPHPGGQN